MSHESKRKDSRKGGGRPFPWRCPRCLTPDAVHLETVPCTAEIAHDGRTYRLDIPALQVPRCRSCGELIFSHAADEQIRQALRS